MTLTCCFIFGLCAGGRVCVGLNWMNEFMTLDWQNFCTTSFNVCDSCVMIV